MDSRILHDLVHLAGELSPRSLLVICTADHPLPASLQSRQPPLPFHRVDPEIAHEALKSLGRQELVLALDVLGQLPRDRATHLIAELRDLYSESLYVLALPTQSADWEEQDLVALGLTRVRSYPPEDGGLFRFNVKDYKKTPDWLNPRFWANPEMWDKARW